MKFETTGWESLHTHSDYSLLDGFGRVEEYANKWKAHGDYLCISDHGLMAAIPNQIKCCEASGHKDDPYRNKRLIPIFACELYVNPMQIEYDNKEEFQKYINSLNPDELKILRKRGYHLLAIASNDIGYKNLVQLSSLAWTKGFYYRPRVNHEQLMKYKEGIIFTSCCYASEIAQAFDIGGEDAGFEMLEKYMAMFSPNFYLEIMLLDFAKQKPYNQFILKAHDKYGLKVILTNDVHYCNKEDSKYQRIMLMIQTKKTISSINKQMEEEGVKDLFELQDPNLWLKTEDELNEKWLNDYSDVIDYDLFKQSKINTIEICKQASGVKIDKSIKLPKFPNANERLKEEMLEGFRKRNLPQTKVYKNRLIEEYNLICRKDFASYFLIDKMIVDEARRISPILLGWDSDGTEALGPGRGSAAGSLICYCLGITDINPIHHDLLFSRFLSPVRGGKSLKLKFTEDPI